MTPRNSIAWFKATWQTEIAAAIAGTPFCENMLAAIAWQETGYLWSPLIGAHAAAEILKLCAGDTIEAPRRSAFPKNRADLESRADGPRMFREAREALERVVRMTGTYRAAARNPDKFCHGFGIFQYDLQFFLEDADFFLEKRWHDFAECLSRFIAELRRAMTRVYGARKTTLTDEEKVYVAIAYNRGSADPGKGFKQGHRNDEGEYYGENVWEYFQLAKSLTSIPAGTPGQPAVVIAEPGREGPVAPLRPEAGAPPPAYPGRVIRRNSPLTASVALIQKRLRGLGYTERKPDGTEQPLSADGNFGINTENAVQLFQFRHTDNNGLPLAVDGTVGPATWGALFGLQTLPAPLSTDDAPLLAATLKAAAAEVGVMETPPGSNRGPRVSEYLAAVGLEPGFAWCAAFVYWCFRQAAKSQSVANPAIRTAGVLDMWNRAVAGGFHTVTASDAAENPGLLRPGMVFVFSTGGGFGHTGFVAGINGFRIETIEGNTDVSGSRNGIGVFRRSRSISSVNCGFIDYSRPRA